MKGKEYSKERYEFYKSHGICVECGREPAYKGHTRCLECRFKSVERSKKTQAKHEDSYREYQREYQKKLRQHRKENGLCQQCGKPTNNGYSFCTEHLAVRRARQENRRREQGTLPRSLMGKGEFCYFCGKPVEKYGDKTCAVCHERESEWSAKMRERIDYDNHIWRKENNAIFAKR